MGTNLSKSDFKIVRLDDEKMLVFGYASMAIKADGERVVDSQDDIVSPETLESAAYDYVLRSRDGGLLHDKRGVARLVESFVVTSEKLKALGLEQDALPQAWFVGFKVDDPAVWKRVRSGELRAFSIGGRARSKEAA